MTDFIDNTEKSRFEYHIDGATVFANYRRKDGTLFIEYVEAPQQLRGSGAAGRLMAYITETAVREKMKITPICGYAASWYRRHPEHEALLN